MTTEEINSIYRVTPDYPRIDAYMTHGAGLGVWTAINEYMAEMGLVLIDTFDKEVYSLFKLEYYRNCLSLYIGSLEWRLIRSI